MSCQQYDKQISQYLADDLSADQRAALEAHVAQCQHCQRALQAERAIAEQLADMPLKALPDGYAAELRARLVNVKPEKPVKTASKLFSRHRKWLVAIAACLIVALSVVPLLDNIWYETTDKAAYEESALSYGEGMVGGEMSEAKGEVSEMDYNEEVLDDVATVEMSRDAAPKMADDLQARKLIKRGTIELSVVDYDVALDNINGLIGQYSGYVENSTVARHQNNSNSRSFDYRKGYMILRIPSEQFEVVFAQLLKFGEVSYQEQTSEDLTDVYRDTVNEIKNLEVRETALRKIMTQAETVEDIITVEAELSRVRGQINDLTGNLQQWDRLIDMSTIQLTISEQPDAAVVQPIDDDLSSRARRAFVGSLNGITHFLENIFVGIVGLLPIIVPILLIIAIVLAMWRRKKK